MKATEADKRHFAVIGEESRAEEEATLDAFLAMSLGERLAAGFALMSTEPWTPQQLAEIDAATDGQIELARRRIAMGLTLRYDTE